MEYTRESADPRSRRLRPSGGRFIEESTMFKLLLDRDGLLLSVTTKRRAFYLFFSRLFVGLKVAPTTDPYPGIVEMSDYEIRKILANWTRLSRVLVKHPGS